MLSELFTTKAIEAVLELAKQRIKKAEAGAQLATNADQIEQAIETHLDYVRRWSAEISFVDLLQSKKTARAFVPLNAFVVPLRLRMDAEEKPKSVELLELIGRAEGHIVVLGAPGAGKTTTVKHLAQRLITDDDFLEDASFPLVVRLDELNALPVASNKWKGFTLIHYLAGILGLAVTLPDWLRDHPDSETHRQRLLFNVVATTLNALRPLILLDGFDEVAPGGRRDDVVDAVSYLTTRLDRATVVLTSRTGEFQHAIPHSSQFEIAPLTHDQIRTFAHSWLGDGGLTDAFVAKILASPFGDTAIRPLTMGHLCAIYERTGDIPAKPRTVYRKIVNLLVDEWDQQRGVKRISKYADFEVDRKVEFLAQLSYALTIGFRRTRFARVELASTYRKVCWHFGLRPEEAMQVVREIESHTGLLVQTGYDEFAFAHKSLQEFLAADHLVRLPTLPPPGTLKFMPNEVAIAVAISADAGEYIRAVFQDRAMWQYRKSGWTLTFVTRLLLEAPELAGNKRVSQALVVLFTAYVEDWRDESVADILLDTAFVGIVKLLERLVKREAVEFIALQYSPDSSYTDIEGVARFVRKTVAVAASEQLTDDIGDAARGPAVLYLPRSLERFVRQ